MKKLASLLLLLTVVTFVGCDEESQQAIASIKTVSHRIEDLGKTSSEIKNMEDDAALMKEDLNTLEYEYPIREHESYVVTYHFKNDKCIKIKLDTYLDKESYATKIQQEVMADLANNKSFSKTKFKDDTYKWKSNDSSINVALETQHIERGTINLSITIK